MIAVIDTEMTETKIPEVRRRSGQYDEKPIIRIAFVNNSRGAVLACNLIAADGEMLLTAEQPIQPISILNSYVTDYAYEIANKLGEDSVKTECEIINGSLFDAENSAYKLRGDFRLSNELFEHFRHVVQGDSSHATM